MSNLAKKISWFLSGKLCIYMKMYLSEYLLQMSLERVTNRSKIFFVNIISPSLTPFTPKISPSPYLQIIS